MNFDSSFPKRVATARQSVGMTQAELAKAVGVVQRQIAAYEGAEARPREKVLVNLAAALGTSVAWLTTGQGEGPNTSHIKRTVTVREVPLLTYAQAMGGDFDFDDFYENASASDFIPAPPNAGEYAFALEVEGDSMQSAGTPSFPSGSIIIVDPHITPENGDFGLFSLPDDDHFTFKQFIIDQGRGYLRSLNPAYPAIAVSLEPEAIGKVISSQQVLNNRTSKQSMIVGNFNNYSVGSSVSGSDDLLDRLVRIEEKMDRLLDALSSLKNE